MDKKTIILLLAIVIAGLSIRIYDLGKESLWKDEAAVLYTVEKENAAEVTKSAIFMHRGHPPLNFVILHFWTRIFGNSEFAARMPSVIFGTLSILMVFLVAKELFDKKTALLSSLMLSTSMIQIVYSQEIKQYAMFAFFTLLSSYFFIRLLKKENNADYVLYAVSTILMLYSHYFSLFVLLFENIAVLFLKESISIKSLKKWIFSQAAIIISYIPLIPAIIGAIIISHPSIQTGLVFRGFPKWLTAPGVFYLIAPFIAGIFLVYFLIRKKEKLKKIRIRFSQNLFLAVVVAVFAFLIFAEPHLTKPVYITKYVFFAIPFFYILFARGIANLDKRLAATIIVLLIGINFALIANYYAQPTKSQWREAANFVESNQNEKDIIVYSGELNILPFDYYYTGSLERIDFFTGEPFDENFLKYNNMLLPEAHEKLEKRFSEKSGAWVLISYGHNMTIPFMEWMDSLYTLKTKQDYKDIGIYYYSLSKR